INMGCPVHNVASQGKGSGLIRHPDTAAEIIQASKAGGLPVSVKTRLGYTHLNEWYDWIKHIFEQDIANISIPLRTKKEMSDPAHHWELIPENTQRRDVLAAHT